MNRSTFRTIRYMNGSGFFKAKYTNGVGFKILARPPVPQLPPSYMYHLYSFLSILPWLDKQISPVKSIPCLSKRENIHVVLRFISFSFSVVTLCIDKSNARKMILILKLNPCPTE